MLYSTMVRSSSWYPVVEQADSVDGAGLLQLGVNDIGQKVVFDGKGTEAKPLGNKITCEFKKPHVVLEQY